MLEINLDTSYLLPSAIFIFSLLFFFTKFISQSKPQTTYRKNPPPTFSPRPPQITDKIKQYYNLEIPYDKESPIIVQKLFVYPCRGIKGFEVDQVKVYPSGLKYDREWAIIEKKSKAHYGLGLHPNLSLLRQRIAKDAQKKRFLVLSVCEGHEDIVAKLPSKELWVEMVEEPKGERIVNEKYEGIVEGKESEKWLSAFAGKPLQLVRSPKGKTTELFQHKTVYAREDDIKKNMHSKSAIHAINEASIRELRSRVLARYNPEQQKQLSVVHDNFRPNILFDSGTAYSEDTFFEARIGSVMLRLVGHCARCAIVPINFNTNDYNLENEPNETLRTFRKHEKLGVMFGVFFQPEIIGSVQEYNRLLRGYPPVANSRFHEGFGIVKKGDELRVRVQEERLLLNGQS